MHSCGGDALAHLGKGDLAWQLSLFGRALGQFAHAGIQPYGEQAAFLSINAFTDTHSTLHL